MKTADEIKSALGVSNVEELPFSDGMLSFIYRFTTGNMASVIVSPYERGKDGKVLEHASCSMANHRKTATWDEMCELKNLVWKPEEECYQLHPKESEYVHGVGGLGNVLHIWRDK